jgi:hypothetical protein
MTESTSSKNPRREAAQALAQLSDAEWLQVKCAEDRRRAEQRNIRSLSKRYRELRKLDPEPARGSGTRCGQEESHDEQTRTT